MRKCNRRLKLSLPAEVQSVVISVRLTLRYSTGTIETDLNFPPLPATILLHAQQLCRTDYHSGNELARRCGHDHARIAPPALIIPRRAHRVAGHAAHG